MHCSAPRQWERSAVDLVVRVARRSQRRLVVRDGGLAVRLAPRDAAEARVRRVEVRPDRDRARQVVVRLVLLAVADELVREVVQRFGDLGVDAQRRLIHELGHLPRVDLGEHHAEVHRVHLRQWLCDQP